jgi:DNA-directed RNA polymerase subunit RPC12/RpoP
MERFDNRVESRCIYCDKKFKVDEEEDYLYYRCPHCRLHDVQSFIATKW